MKKSKRIWGLLATGILCLGLAGCGNKDAESSNTAPQFVYVPEYVNIPSSEDMGYMDIVTAGNMMYYNKFSYDETTQHGSNIFFSMDVSVKDAAPVEIPVQMSPTQNMMRMVPDAEGNLYIVLSVAPDTTGIENVDWEELNKQTTYSVIKAAPDGTTLFSTDITEYLRMDEQSAYIQYMAVDKEGRMYLSNGNSYIWVFDKDGKHLFDLKLDNWVMGIGANRAGEIYVLRYGNTGQEIVKINVDTKDFDSPLSNLPDNIYNSSIQPGFENGLLLNGSSALYNYDTATQQCETVLNWLDNDIINDKISYISVLPDDRLLLLMRGDEGKQEIMLLTKTEASNVKEKQLLTLGVFYMDSETKQAIVKFNKTNDTYRVQVKDYSENMGNGETAYQDAITKMNNEIITGTAPDLISMSYNVNIKQLVTKGVVEDLGPYLDKSTVVKREDIVDSVLKAYTMEGKLVAIPSSFNIVTMAGKASEVGDKMGWTLDELMAMVATKPADTQVMQYGTKSSMLYNSLAYNEGVFIDWSTGTCKFNTDDFMKILEFANKMPKEINYDDANDNSMELLRTGKVLLTGAYLSSPQDYQVTKHEFGGEKVTFVGYPCMEGSGAFLNGSNTFAISSKSKYKDGAWAFVESFLTEEFQKKSEKWDYRGFPTLKTALDDMNAKYMEAQYQTDENGDPVKDESGNAVEISNSSMSWGNGESMDIYAATQEEVDDVMELINNTTQLQAYDNQVMNIITEEAAPYFEGQKSAQEVADIIQSRVQIYVDENR